MGWGGEGGRRRRRVGGVAEGMAEMAEGIGGGSYGMERR